MKSKKKYAILLSVFAIIMAATIILSLPSKDEKFAQKFITEFYSLSEYDLSTYLTKETPENINTVKKYEDYFTYDAYAKLSKNLNFDEYNEMAYLNKCTLDVKDVDIIANSDVVVNDVSSFKYTITIDVNYSDLDKNEEITQSGTINVVNKDDLFYVSDLTIIDITQEPIFIGKID